MKHIRDSKMAKNVNADIAEKAISLLWEWVYELAPLSDSDKESLRLDYERLHNNTMYFF